MTVDNNWYCDMCWCKIQEEEYALIVKKKNIYEYIDGKKRKQ